MSDQALCEEFRLLVASLEFVERKHLILLIAHDVVIESHKQVFALLDCIFPLGELVTEKVDGSLIAAVEEHSLCLLSQFAS